MKKETLSEQCRTYTYTQHEHAYLHRFKNEDTVEVFRRHPSKNLIRSTLVAIAVAHTLLELHSSTNLERHIS